MSKARAFWSRVKGFNYGEAVLWCLFLGAFLSAFEDENCTTLAGVCVIAVIGVRVTRAPKSKATLDAD